MVTKVHGDVVAGKGTDAALLEAHPAYPSFRQHMSAETKEALFSRLIHTPALDVHRSAMEGKSTMSKGLQGVLDDIDRVARKWGLQP